MTLVPYFKIFEQDIYINVQKTKIAYWYFWAWCMIVYNIGHQKIAQKIEEYSIPQTIAINILRITILILNQITSILSSTKCQRDTAHTNNLQIIQPIFNRERATGFHRCQRNDQMREQWTCHEVFSVHFLLFRNRKIVLQKAARRRNKDKLKACANSIFHIWRDEHGMFRFHSSRISENQKCVQ